ncbi:hypothetical protein DY000_02052702 [Brassica cretica]|uniref:Uncharacterized protein n=1 Tax=Brassica cretica TaxID=69181 RepID=A0ABQ7AK60_BRACR|nr:hypothetical protein DY000_02052702 [Brassica cretica]
MREEPADGAQHQADARRNVPGVGGAPQQGAGRNEQLPPPPKRQDLGGRAFLVGDHEGGEPIVGMFPIPT